MDARVEPAHDEASSWLGSSLYATAAFALTG
jgi:hypothetical protein